MIEIIILGWFVIGWLSGQLYFWVSQKSSKIDIILFGKMILCTIGGFITTLILTYQYIKYKDTFKKKF